MSVLSEILQDFRGTAQSEREKGEGMVKGFLQDELVHRDVFGDKVCPCTEWHTPWQQLGTLGPDAGRGFRAPPGGGGATQNDSKIPQL